MLMQNVGVTNKEHCGMLRYFWGGQFYCFYRLTFSVTSKAPKFTETFTSELGLDKRYFDSRFYGTLLSLVSARSSSLNFFVKNKSVKTISTKYHWYYSIEAVRE